MVSRISLILFNALSLSVELIWYTVLANIEYWFILFRLLVEFCKEALFIASWISNIRVKVLAEVIA